MKSRILASIALGAAMGYALQFAFAIGVGYSPLQAALPCETWRIRATLTPDDPWVQQVAARACTPESADAMVHAAIRYDFSPVVWAGKERIPTVAETRSVGMRGDCKAIAVALGSVLKAKGISFTVRSTVDHVWIEYAPTQEDAR